MNTGDYLPISEYGAIGNLRTVALLGPNGSIDWWCPPHIDRPSVFAALLDHRRGGRFQVAPVAREPGRLEYIRDSNVLRTRFDTAGGRATVTDFMPLRGNIEGRGDSEGPPEIHRVLEAGGGGTDFMLEWSPRLDYARPRVRIEQVANGFIAEAEGEYVALEGLEPQEIEAVSIDDDGTGPVLRGELRVEPGRRRALVTRWKHEPREANARRSIDQLETTLETWRAWLHKNDIEREWAGEWTGHVVRSELALKLLCHAESGAIAAAATTSLPEKISGVRNWDYRCAWVRDASRTAQVLFALGHVGDSNDFLKWIEQVSHRGEERRMHLQVLYGVRGVSDLTERVLDHLEGYRGSRPVRIGNAAVHQRQLDVYGEILDAAYLLVQRGKRPDTGAAEFLARVANRACDSWRQPDLGIWEMRREPMHFVYSKAMVWVALDRAVRLADQGILRGDDVARWRSVAATIRRVVLERGYDAEQNAFVQAFGSTHLDAANLLLPLLGIVRIDDPRVQGTLDATMDRLLEGDLVRRYYAPDGLPGGEGAFGLATHWLIYVLALSGRLEEGWNLFERFMSRAGSLGLFSEQINPRTGEFLGNYPQAYTHVGILNSLVHLRQASGVRVPEPVPFGLPDEVPTAPAV